MIGQPIDFINLMSENSPAEAETQSINLCTSGSDKASVQDFNEPKLDQAQSLGGLQEDANIDENYDGADGPQADLRQKYEMYEKAGVEPVFPKEISKSSNVLKARETAYADIDGSIGAREFVVDSDSKTIVYAEDPVHAEPTSDVVNSSETYGEKPLKISDHEWEESTALPIGKISQGSSSKINLIDRELANATLNQSDGSKLSLVAELSQVDSVNAEISAIPLKKKSTLNSKASLKSAADISARVAESTADISKSSQTLAKKRSKGSKSILNSSADIAAAASSMPDMTLLSQTAFGKTNGSKNVLSSKAKVTAGFTLSLDDVTNSSQSLAKKRAKGSKNTLSSKTQLSEPIIGSQEPASSSSVDFKLELRPQVEEILAINEKVGTTLDPEVLIEEIAPMQHQSLISTNDDIVVTLPFLSDIGDTSSVFIQVEGNGSYAAEVSRNIYKHPFQPTIEHTENDAVNMGAPYANMDAPAMQEEEPLSNDDAKAAPLTSERVRSVAFDVAITEENPDSFQQEASEPESSGPIAKEQSLQFKFMPSDSEQSSNDDSVIKSVDPHITSVDPAIADIALSVEESVGKDIELELGMNIKPPDVVISEAHLTKQISDAMVRTPVMEGLAVVSTRTPTTSSVTSNMVKEISAADMEFPIIAEEASPLVNMEFPIVTSQPSVPVEVPVIISARASSPTSEAPLLSKKTIVVKMESAVVTKTSPPVVKMASSPKIKDLMPSIKKVVINDSIPTLASPGKPMNSTIVAGFIIASNSGNYSKDLPTKSKDGLNSMEDQCSKVTVVPFITEEMAPSKAIMVDDTELPVKKSELIEMIGLQTQVEVPLIVQTALNKQNDNAGSSDQLEKPESEQSVVWFKCFLRNESRIIVCEEDVTYENFCQNVIDSFFGLCTSCAGNETQLFLVNNFGKKVLGPDHSMKLFYPSIDGEKFSLDCSATFLIAVSMSKELSRAFVPIFCSIIDLQGNEIEDILTPLPIQLANTSSSFANMIAYDKFIDHLDTVRELKKYSQLKINPSTGTAEHAKPHKQAISKRNASSAQGKFGNHTIDIKIHSRSPTAEKCPWNFGALKDKSPISKDPDSFFSTPNLYRKASQIYQEEGEVGSNVVGCDNIDRHTHVPTSSVKRSTNPSLRNFSMTSAMTSKIISVEANRHPITSRIIPSAKQSLFIEEEPESFTVHDVSHTKILESYLDCSQARKSHGNIQKNLNAEISQMYDSSHAKNPNADFGDGSDSGHHTQKIYILNAKAKLTRKLDKNTPIAKGSRSTDTKDVGRGWNRSIVIGRHNSDKLSIFGIEKERDAAILKSRAEQVPFLRKPAVRPVLAAIRHALIQKKVPTVQVERRALSLSREHRNNLQKLLNQKIEQNIAVKRVRKVKRAVQSLKFDEQTQTSRNDLFSNIPRAASKANVPTTTQEIVSPALIVEPEASVVDPSELHDGKYYDAAQRNSRLSRQPNDEFSLMLARDVNDGEEGTETSNRENQMSSRSHPKIFREDAAEQITTEKELSKRQKPKALQNHGLFDEQQAEDALPPQMSKDKQALSNQQKRIKVMIQSGKPKSLLYTSCGAPNLSIETKDRNGNKQNRMERDYISRDIVSQELHPLIDQLALLKLKALYNEAIERASCQSHAKSTAQLPSPMQKYTSKAQKRQQCFEPRRHTQHPELYANPFISNYAAMAQWPSTYPAPHQNMKSPSRTSPGNDFPQAQPVFYYPMTQQEAIPYHYYNQGIHAGNNAPSLSKLYKLDQHLKASQVQKGKAVPSNRVFY